MIGGKTYLVSSSAPLAGLEDEIAFAGSCPIDDILGYFGSWFDGRFRTFTFNTQYRHRNYFISAAFAAQDLKITTLPSGELVRGPLLISEARTLDHMLRSRLPPHVLSSPYWSFHVHHIRVDTEGNPAPGAYEELIRLYSQVAINAVSSS